MQYVDVAVNTKTQKIDQTFTYSIPPALLPQIKPGILVEVPFRGRKLEGVVLAIRRQVDKRIRGKLKPISKILDPRPVLDPIRLNLAQWISNYYLAALGETIFTMLPPLARRLATRNYHETKLSTNLPRKLSRSIYTIYDRPDNRVRDYIKLTEKVIQKNRQAIILFPEIAGKEKIFAEFEKELGKNNIVYLHGELSRTQRYQNWLDIRAGKKKVVIGSRSAIFAPCNKLGLIIIDQPENFGYKEEQSPRYNTLTVAKKLSHLSNSHLVLGSFSPSVENFYYEEVGEYRILKKCQMSNVKCQISIVDSNKDRGVISWKMEKGIGETLDRKGRIILFINRRGAGSALTCFDCGYIFSCPRCEIPLVPYSQRTTNSEQRTANLRCHKCNYQSPIPSICPKCQGVKLKTTGLGTERLQQEIKRIFPQTRTVIIEKNSITNNQLPITSYDIIIGTKKILDYPNIEADLVGIIGIDNALNLPDFRSPENTLLTIVELVSRAKKQVLVQTFNPENETIQAIAKKEFEQFFKKEIEKRKQAGYPPFAQLIKLVYQDKDEQKCQRLTEDLYRKIKLEIENCPSRAGSREKLKIDLLGPSPCFVAKRRDKYRYQIILKGKQNQINSLLKPPCLAGRRVTQYLTGWTIDVDPIDLL